MSVATYTVEIAWQGRNTGAFRIGTSTIGGADTLGGFFGASAFDDVTSETKSITIRRGRQSDLEPIDAGECTLVLSDTTGKYNPTNTSSSLYGNLVPLRPVRIQASFSSTTYGLFYGFVRSIIADPDKSKQQVYINCIDLFVWLQRAYPVISATGSTNTGAAIGTVLDEIEWTMASFRDLDTGDSIPDFSGDGTSSVLSLIQDLLEAERGVFFINGSGVAVYEDRAARSKRTTSQSTISNTMKTVLPTADLDQIRNRARVTRSGGTQQTYTDDSSRYEYGYSDYTPVTTSYLNNDTEAAQLARWMVFQRKDPHPPIRVLELLNSTDAILTIILARELQDRVTITESQGGTSGDYHIEGIQHEIAEGGRRHLARWILRQRGAQAFIIGTSTIEGGDVIGF